MNRESININKKNLSTSTIRSPTLFILISVSTLAEENIDMDIEECQDLQRREITYTVKSFNLLKKIITNRWDCNIKLEEHQC